MKDRVPLYPGRVKLTPVSGQANTYDMVRADEPTQEGTPLNKASLLTDATAALFGLGTDAVPNDALLALSEAAFLKKNVRAGSCSVGDIVKLSLNGVETEFIVVNQGIPGNATSTYDASCDGTWLLMKDIYTVGQWNSADTADYPASSVHQFLNTEFLAQFDQDIQNAIQQVKIPFYNTSGSISTGANGLSTKAFLLSATEANLGYDSATQPVNEGACLEYFVGANKGINPKRIAYYQGADTAWWWRSPYLAASGRNMALASGVNGNWSAPACSSECGIRPAIILPYDAMVRATTVGVTDVLGNLIAIPADQIKDGVKIATGSYTGTGTYGSSHPNSLTFAFEPAVLLVSLPGNYGLEGFGYDSSSNVTYAMIGSVLTTSYKQYFGIGVNANAAGYGKKSSDGKKFSWYNTASAENQWNSSKKVYHYIAIG